MTETDTPKKKRVSITPRKKYIRKPLALRQDQWDALDALAVKLDAFSRSGVSRGKASWRTLIAMLAEDKLQIHKPYLFGKLDHIEINGEDISGNISTPIPLFYDEPVDWTMNKYYPKDGEFRVKWDPTYFTERHEIRGTFDFSKDPASTADIDAYLKHALIERSDTNEAIGLLQSPQASVLTSEAFKDAMEAFKKKWQPTIKEEQKELPKSEYVLSEEDHTRFRDMVLKSGEKLSSEQKTALDDKIAATSFADDELGGFRIPHEYQQKIMDYFNENPNTGLVRTAGFCYCYGHPFECACVEKEPDADSK